MSLEGAKQGLHLSGQASYTGGLIRSTLCTAPPASSPFEGLVSEDGKTITIQLTTPSYYSESVGMAIFKRCNAVRIDHWTPLKVVLSRP